MRLLKQLDEKLSAEDKYERKHGTSFDEIIETVQKDCKKFLLLIKSGGVVYRGSHNKHKPLEKYAMRTGVRKPRNTDKKIHIHFNKLFKEKFGWKVRDGIFTSGNYSQTVLYGDAYYFFPIGSFKFVYSTKHIDLFSHPISAIPPGADYSFKEYVEKKKATFTRITNTYTDTDLSRGITLGTEISFKCKSYYMIPEDPYLWKYMAEIWGVKR